MLLLLLLVGEGKFFLGDMHKSFVFFPIESRVFALHFTPDYSICCSRCNRACAQVLDRFVAAGGHTHLSTTNAKNDVVCLYFDSGKKRDKGSIWKCFSANFQTNWNQFGSHQRCSGQSIIIRVLFVM